MFAICCRKKISNKCEFFDLSNNRKRKYKLSLGFRFPVKSAPSQIGPNSNRPQVKSAPSQIGLKMKVISAQKNKNKKRINK